MKLAKLFNKRPPFGTILRAYRLRWNWWNSRNCFVRFTPLADRITVEVARTFAALNTSEHPLGTLHSVVDADDDLLMRCEPLRGKFSRDYHCWEVDDDGRCARD